MITAVTAAVVDAAAVAVAAAAVAQIAVAAAAAAEVAAVAEISAAASVPPSRQATAYGQVLHSPPPVTSVGGQRRSGPGAVAVGAASAV